MSDIKKRNNQGVNHPQYGKPKSEETKRKIGEKSKERLKDKKNHHLYGKELTKEHCENISKGRKGKYIGKDNHFSNAKKYSEGKSNGMYGKKHSEETIEKMLKARFESQKIRPNKLEKEFCIFLNQLFPKEYKYVGDFQFVLGGKCPDFINVNGQKKIIELFGNYWHEKEDVKKRVDHFKKYGWNCLVVWEDEFKNKIKSVERKLLKYHTTMRG